MTDHTNELAGLPDTAPEAVRRFRASISGHALTVSEKGAVLIALDKCADELERLARENAELRSAAGRGELSILKDLADARETIKRLNRRVQVAEAGIAEKAKAAAPGSLGRSLANAAADMFMYERDEAQAELAALKRKIAEAPTDNVFEAMNGTGVIYSHGGLPRKWIGQRVALLPVGGE